MRIVSSSMPKKIQCPYLHCHTWCVLAMLCISNAAMAVSFHPDEPAHATGASSSLLPGVGYFYTGRGGCTAQAIDPVLLITAAHCTNDRTVSNGSFRVDLDGDGGFEVTREVRRFIPHPDWRYGPSERPRIEFRADLAIIVLRTPLPPEVPIYRIRNDIGPIAGMPVMLGGYGQQGVVGNVRSNNADGAFDRQHAFNIIESQEYGTLLGSTMRNRYASSRFRPPGSAGDGWGFAEGIIQAGDSGGGVFTSPYLSASYYEWRFPNVFTKPQSSTPELVAINSAGISDNGEFGSTATFVHLAPYLDWIKAQVTLNANLVTTATQLTYLETTAVSHGNTMQFAAPPDDVNPEDLPGDAFPGFPEARLDTDGDGAPDNWVGVQPVTTPMIRGLYLDKFPYDGEYVIDDDFDAIADQWENEYFDTLDTVDYVSDFDNDGTEDRYEFLRRTDPTDGATEPYGDLYTAEKLNRRYELSSNRSSYVFTLPFGVDWVETVTHQGESKLTVFNDARLTDASMVCESRLTTAVNRCSMDEPTRWHFARVDLSGSETASVNINFIRNGGSQGLVLNRNEWMQFSIAIDTTEAPTVRQTFHDFNSVNFREVDYGRDWVVFGFNARENRYSDIGYSGALERGKGYWVIQDFANDVTVYPRAQVAGTFDASTVVNTCTVSDCLVADLADQRDDGDIGVWNLAGYPWLAASDFSELQFFTDSVIPCADGCSAVEAMQQGLIHTQAYRWNATAATYDVIEPGKALSRWHGYWIAAIEGDAHGYKIAYPRRR